MTHIPVHTQLIIQALFMLWWKVLCKSDNISELSYFVLWDSPAYRLKCSSEPAGHCASLECSSVLPFYLEKHPLFISPVSPGGASELPESPLASHFPLPPSLLSLASFYLQLSISHLLLSLCQATPTARSISSGLRPPSCSLPCLFPHLCIICTVCSLIPFFLNVSPWSSFSYHYVLSGQHLPWCISLGTCSQTHALGKIFLTKSVTHDSVNRF